MFSGQVKFNSITSAIEEKFPSSRTLPRQNKSSKQLPKPKHESFVEPSNARRLSDDSTQSARSGEIQIRSQNLGMKNNSGYANALPNYESNRGQNAVGMSTFRGITPKSISRFNSNWTVDSFNCSTSTLNHSPNGAKENSIADSGISCNNSDQPSPVRRTLQNLRAAWTPLHSSSSGPALSSKSESFTYKHPDSAHSVYISNYTSENNGYATSGNSRNANPRSNSMVSRFRTKNPVDSAGTSPGYATEGGYVTPVASRNYMRSNDVTDAAAVISDDIIDGGNGSSELIDEDDLLEFIMAEAETKAVNSIRRKSTGRQSFQSAMMLLDLNSYGQEMNSGPFEEKYADVSKKYFILCRPKLQNQLFFR